MLLEAFLSHLKSHPRSPLHRLTFDQAIEDRALYICLKNLAFIAQRASETRRTDERPALELT